MRAQSTEIKDHYFPKLEKKPSQFAKKLDIDVKVKTNYFSGVKVVPLSPAAVTQDYDLGQGEKLIRAFTRVKDVRKDQPYTVEGTLVVTN